jgi:chemotaxis protein CheZ
VKIFEACNFQDLTGQRITKVVRALSFIEERVEAMMGVWNKREFETMPLPPGMAAKDGDLDLHGPNKVDQSKGMISQADIDALFG